MVQENNSNNYQYGNSEHLQASNNLISIISNCVDAQKQIKTQLKYLSKISRHISSSIRHVRQLLDVSKSSELVIEQKIVSMNLVFNEIAPKFEANDTSDSGINLFKLDPISQTSEGQGVLASFNMSDLSSVSSDDSKDKEEKKINKKSKKQRNRLKLFEK